MKTVKFIAFADLHVDIMFDSIKRVKAVIEAAKSENADFILNLGDILYPPNDFMVKHNVTLRKDKWFYCERDGEKREILAMLSGCGIPVYHVIGNHDSDANPKKVFCDYMGMAHNYYSFDVGGFHFAALDTSYIREKGIDIPYQERNVTEAGLYPCVSGEQLIWLKNDVLASGKPTVLLSHHPLYKGGVGNYEQVFETVREINSDKKLIRLCVNGHTHLDGLQTFSDIPCLDINSISHHWVGWEYRYARYSEKTEAEYPYISSVVPYKEPVLACIDISLDRAAVKGTSSVFAEPCPYTLGMKEDERHYICTAEIKDYEISL
jgi:Icc-related predicted phosphoesterase